MPRTATVAYEEKAKDCGCKHGSYAAKVTELAKQLGATHVDPEYLARAEKVGLDPKLAAATAYALNGSPKQEVAVALETVAKDYVAIDYRGRRIFGPSKDYDEAKRQADRSGGYVGYAAPSTQAPVAAEAVAVQTTETVVVAAEGPHSLPAPEPQIEPYKKPLRWHRGKKDGQYEAKAGALGTFRVESRPPDRRHGVLPWTASLGDGWIVQTETKCLAQKMAEKHARNPVPRPKAGSSAPACIAVVERTPDCRPTHVKLDSAKDAFEILRAKYDRQGYETFEVLGATVQGEMVGAPVTVAQGSTTHVHVEVSQVLAAAIGLNAGGATQVWVAHGHPSSHHEPSPEDKDLTKKIRAGFKAALPNVEFKGHLVCGRSGFSLA